MDWQFVIESIIYIAISVTVPFIVSFLKTKISDNKMKQVIEFSELAVQYVEKVYGKYSGETRLKHATEWLSNRTSEIGIKLSDEQIRGILEASLKNLELKFSEEWSKKKDNETEQK